MKRGIGARSTRRWKGRRKEGRMVPESNESLEKLVLLIPKSRRITVTDIRAITGSITGPLIWRSLLGRGKGFITGMGEGGGGVARRNRASAAALKSRRQPTPLILCAHENLRELWQAAVVALTRVSKTRLYVNPLPPPLLPYNRNSRERSCTRYSNTFCTRRAVGSERKESETQSGGLNERAKRRWAVFNWEELESRGKGGGAGEARIPDANRPTGRDMQADDRSAVRQSSVCIGMQPAGCNGKGNNWYIAMALAADSR